MVCFAVLQPDKLGEKDEEASTNFLVSRETLTFVNSFYKFIYHHMEPIYRLNLTYPIYALSLLPDNGIVVTGGGGLMKSGVPNACVSLSVSPVPILLLSML